MQLKAACTLTITAAAETPLVATLRPRNGHAQWIIKDSYELHPWVPTTEHIDHYGNLRQRLVVPKGTMRIAVESLIEVQTQITTASYVPYTPIEQLPDDVLSYLLPSRYCPSDKMAHLAHQVVGDVMPGYAQIEKIRSWIYHEFTYKHGSRKITMEPLDVLAHGTGMCYDYSHVGIALCRSLHIPARMVVGYLQGSQSRDLHAWFDAFTGGRWYSFDATQAQPTDWHIALAYGRDATDVAFISDYGNTPLKVDSIQVEVTSANDPAATPPSSLIADVPQQTNPLIKTTSPPLWS